MYWKVIATRYFLIIIGLQFQWLEFHIKIHGMAGKQCAFSDQKAGKGSLFSETWAGISTSTKWTPECAKRMLRLFRAIVSIIFFNEFQ